MGTAREDFVEFVAHRSAPLLRTAYLLCGGDQGAAEDLPQDVLERACPRWQRITGPPVAYLRAALANMATNRRPARSRRVAVTADQQDRVLNVTYGGVVDPANPLPVRIALPFSRAWLPADPTTVTVTPKGGRPRTVRLSP